MSIRSPLRHFQRIGPAAHGKVVSVGARAVSQRHGYAIIALLLVLTAQSRRWEHRPGLYARNRGDVIMPKPKQEPTWQPLSQLPMIAYMIDGMTDSAEEQLVNMRQAEERPHVLDNATLDRLTQVYTEQQGDLWLYGVSSSAPRKVVANVCALHFELTIDGFFARWYLSTE